MQFTSEKSCGQSSALGVSPLVRRPATPDAAASTLNPPYLSSITVAELRDCFLDWLQRHRSPALHREARRHLQRFCEACAGLHAVEIAGSHLEAFQDALRASGHDQLYYPGNKKGHIPTRSASEGPMKSSESRRRSPWDD